MQKPFPHAMELTEYLKADAYRIMRAKLLHDGFARAHLESFADFVNVKIPSCLSEHAPIVVVHEATNTEHIIEIQGVRFNRPCVREANGAQRTVTPHECQIRRLTYQFDMLITARYMIRDRATGNVMHSVVFRDKVFDHIPCMKLSEFCVSAVDPESMMEDENECGGYFISTGAEKVVVGQEAPRNNYAFVTEDSDGMFKCECRSFNESKFRSTSTLYIHLNPPYVTKDLEERRIGIPRITVRIPFVTDPLPLPVTFKLLGVLDVEAMHEYICIPRDPAWFQARVMDILLYNIDAVVMTQDFAVTRLAHDRGQVYANNRRRRVDDDAAEEAAVAAGSKRPRKNKREAAGGVAPPQETEQERCYKQVAGLISTEFLPHQGYTAESVDAKLVLFGTAVRKLIRVFYGLQDADDRDHYMHRRVMMTSSLMTLLFRKHFTMWRRRMASQVRRDLENGSQFVNVKLLLQANIGGNLQTALSTGNFSMQRGQNNMDGVGQVLNRTEPNAPESHVNRTSNPMNKDGRAIAPRLQNESGIGIIDPWETPEGQACGLMRNMTPMAGVRVGYPVETLIDAVISTTLVDTAGASAPLWKQNGCQVYVSGVLIGTTAQGDKLLKLLRARRATQDIPFDVSIYRTIQTGATTDIGEIHVNGDAGSYWWPLIRVDRMAELRMVLDTVTNEDDLWHTLLSEGIVEVINKDEEVSSVRVALYHQQLVDAPANTYTHVVIHPSQICSVFTARGPLLEFNQAPRVTYQAGMGKQAIGRPLSNSTYRMDTAMHMLWYPARPLVGTFMDEMLNPDGVASLQNPVVCILANGGYNIEDGLIFNRASIERGLFRSTITRSTRDVVRTVENEREELAMPPEGCRSRLHADYSQINPETGVVDPGAQVGPNTVYISKMVHMTSKQKVMGPDGVERDEEVDKVRDRSTTAKTREPSVVDEVIFSKTLEGDTSVRVKTRAVRIPEVGDKFCCLTDDHEVLTYNGWVPIAEVTTDDMVACLEPRRHTVFYNRPDRVWYYEKAPSVVTLDHPNVNMQMTLNHRVVVCEQGAVSLRAAELIVHARQATDLLVCATNGLPTTTDLPAPLRAFIYSPDSTNPFARWQLLGLASLHAMPVTETEFWFCGDERWDAQVAELCALAKVPIKNGTIHLPADVLEPIRVLKSALPTYARGLPQQAMRPFLMGALLRFDNGPQTTFTARVSSQRDALMQLAVHAGLRVQADGKCDLTVTWESVSAVTVQPTDWTIRPWNRSVYCISVPPTEIFCVRRNGIVSWTGNSRYGQKGTIGAIYEAVDMPFCPETGISPDIIINPHALPSRMTIGHLIEKLMGKLAALSGELADGTPFSVSDEYQHDDDHDVVINRISQQLTQYGFSGEGTEVLCDGRTGKKMQMQVFIGPMSYQKLRHMVQDKYHARSRGPVQMQTGQPVEGRHRDGGQRFGEMERDNLLGHGASNLLLERLLVSSDQATVPVCTECGHIAQPPKRNAGSTLFAASLHADKPFCQNCVRHDTVRMCEMPFAYKLSTQEIQALHLKAGFQFEKQ